MAGKRKGKQSGKQSSQRPSRSVDWRRSIDLHGMRVEEALTELDRFINQCILDEDVYQVEVIHGIGTGKVRNAVLKYLQGLSVVKSFRHEPGNPGSTLVDF